MQLPDNLNYPFLHFNLRDLIKKEASSEDFLTVSKCRELLLEKENLSPEDLDARNKRLLYKRILHALKIVKDIDTHVLIVEALTTRKTKQIKIYYLQLC